MSLNNQILIQQLSQETISGTLFVCGNGTDGQLGLGDIINRSSPVQLGTSSDWSFIMTGTSTSYMIKTDNSLWVCGKGSLFGNLGLGSLVSVSSPVQVGSDKSWLKVASNAYHAVALKTDGTLWSWGNNATGQLGLGDIINRSSPTQVGNLTNWIDINSNSDNSCAINEDGFLYVWGDNSMGQLGLGQKINMSSPILLGDLNNWCICSTGYSTCAIKTDGTLWSWGSNTYGELGLGDTINRSSPVQIGTDTDWEDIPDINYGILTLKNNGTLWSCGGINSTGLLGLGDTIRRSSPTQIGSLTSWISPLLCFSSAIQEDRSLWVWGRNTYGVLGLGDTMNRSSPTRLGNDNTWLRKIKNGDHALFIKES